MTERILLALCHPPVDVRQWSEPAPSDPLASLRRSFPDLDAIIRDRRVLDFGCGVGREAIALASAGAAEVVALDIRPEVYETGRQLAQEAGVVSRVRFTSREEAPGSVDVVLSKNSMEHFPDPAGALAAMRRRLHDGGLALITLSPPWLHPYGAHLAWLTPVLWVQLLFPERVVMRVRSRYRDYGAMRYEDVEGGLNKMTLAKFERLVHESGMKVRALRHVAIKRLPLVTRILFVREFCTTRIDCVLQKGSDLVRLSQRPTYPLA